jgi:hypothetical protein
MASYVAVTGPGTAWDDHRLKSDPPRAIVIEVVNSGIQWAEPRDMTLDEACRGPGDGSHPGISSRHMVSGQFFFQDEAAVNVLFSDGSVQSIPADLPPEAIHGLLTGNQKAWKACEEDFQHVGHRRIHWANCAALAVLILSYAWMLFRPRDKRPATAPPASPAPSAAADQSEAGK